jgi:hypothetical protein
MTKEEGAVPDFLRMDQPVSSDSANAKKTGNWHGWPTRDMAPVTLTIHAKPMSGEILMVIRALPSSKKRYMERAGFALQHAGITTSRSLS